MIKFPVTRDEAKKYKYGINLSRRKYDPSRCAYEVQEPGRGIFWQQYS